MSKDKTYTVEAIARQSTMDDITRYWEASGRVNTIGDTGQIVFDNVKQWAQYHGVMEIYTASGDIFFYNVADFYRFKIKENV